MRELPVVFGSHEGLVGVLCEPDRVRADAPAVLFTNVGLNHRVGPNRGWVELARRLAEHGFASLRFDLSGFGDSEPRRDTRSELERAVVDTQEAMDCVAARCGSQTFVLVGNCSGVDSLHATSLRDARVHGAVSIDGFVYRNASYYRRRLWQRITQPARWRRLLERRPRAFLGGRRPPGEVQQVWKRDIPTPERFATDLEQLIARQVRLLFVFTSGVDTHLNHRKQFYEQFGHEADAQVLFFERADHLFSRVADRQALTTAICAWMEERFSRAA